ncbi:hypothetical protein JCM1840_004162 [Sporobolomyces johnsonii]
MSASAQAYSLAGKDAAAKEREDRLLAAKKKLKLYRARTSQRLSSASAATDASLPSPRQARRQSGLASASISSRADVVGNHQHRRSVSKTGFLVGDGAKGHGKRMSKSRASRGSMSGFAAGGKSGHGHTRSRASISISLSAPTQNPGEAIERAITPTPAASRASGLGAPPSWQQGAFPTSPDLPRPSSFHNSTVPLRSTSPLPPPPAPGPPPKHGRHGSRHTRRSSVSNFRESLEIVSGTQLSAHLHPTVSSFASPAPHGAAVPASAVSLSPLPQIAPPAAPTWSTDPQKVLEALKERGRLEVEDVSRSPEQTRQSALEALEGRLAAPSEQISLGTEQPGELFVAPKSPGMTLGVSNPLPPTQQGTYTSSPMIGLGVSSGKRNSWGPIPGTVTAMGGHGAMELGGIAEEDEEEEDERKSSTPVSSPKRSSPSPRKRPGTILVEPRSHFANIVATSTPEATTPALASPAFKRSSMRPLSLSLSSSHSSSGTPSTANFPSTSRSLGQPPSPVDERAHSPGEKRHISVFHSIAASQLENGLPSPPLASTSFTPAVAQRGGLRSLSIGSSHSPSAASERRLPGRSASVSAASSASALQQLSFRKPPTAPLQKRSSISYRNSSVSSLGASIPDYQKRAWRSSLASSSPGATSPAVSTQHYSSFPFGVSGGFGDLEVDDDDVSNGRASVISRSPSPLDARSVADADAEAELASLRTQLEQLEQHTAQLSQTHALEISEFEKKASEEAGEMRSRISELERHLEDERNARRFEVEGLQRELAMAKEAVTDVTDERDSLREDVDGWRARCNKLEGVVRKEREDEALAQAQAKLIGEMRDQIYALVAALERERGEHAETRREVERMLEERVREAAADVHQQRSNDDVALDVITEEEYDDDEASLGMSGRHPFKTASDGSLLSGSSFGQSFSGNTTEDTSIATDLDDSFSTKLSSPPSGHSSFNGFTPSAPGSVRGRDSDVVAALGQLDTLAEEDEEDEEAAIGGGSMIRDERIRMDSEGSASTSSDVMPRTPDKASASEHSRSHSFIRHWSFPKGSVSSARVSCDEDDATFFGYNKHDSLPPLPIADNILPPFLTSSLDINEDEFSFFPPQPAHRPTDSSSSHIRRPSSPRPLDRMNPHARRFSGQHAMKAPPVAPSALVTAALQNHQVPPPLPSPTSSVASMPSSQKSLSRLSFGALIGSLGGWSPSSSVAVAGLPVPATSKLSLSTKVASPLLEEDEEGQEEDVFITTTSGGTPVQLQHQTQRRLRYIKPSEVPQPVAARLGKLNFAGSVCCIDQPVFVV